MNNYTIYHCHTDLSNGVTNIDSVTKFKQYIDRAKQCGMTALGFSEHGNVFQWYEKKQTIEKAGMKYIHAEEFYLCNELFKYANEDGSYFYSSSPLDGEKRVRENHHIVLIARNYDGVKELNHLSSVSFNRDDGHYYFLPRITMDELEHTSDNILVTSACLATPLRSDFQDRFLQFMINNKDRCYLEIQHHNVDEQKRYNKYILELHDEYAIPLITGTDTHSIDQEHADARRLLQKSKNVRFEGEEEFDLIFKTYDELVEAYKIQGVIPENVLLDAIENTNRMADRIEPFEIDKTPKYPHLWKEPETSLKYKINVGVRKRGIQSYPNYQEYVDRIKYEYSVIKHNNAIDYILLMSDIMDYCKRYKIHTGYGRGSVNGSVICWLLGITEMDSIKWNLNFSRFMNEERVSLPDIDTDYPPDKRDQVINYLFSHKGLYCSDIITFNTIDTKGAVRDVCRGIYKTPEDDSTYLKISDTICNLIDNGTDEKNLSRKYPEIFKMVKVCKGTVVSIGVHACGRLVYDHPLDDVVGLCKVKTSERPVSQLYMHELDAQNYVKLDFLGLDTIQLISQTCKLADIPFLNPDNLDIKDDKVWSSIREDTTGIFQWESKTAQSYLQKLLSDDTLQKMKLQNGGIEPDKIELLSIGNAAIRPAGESYRDSLASGEVIKSGNDEIDKYFADTSGRCVYQEQIIGFLNKFCGYSMGEADVIRRGFAKKTGTEQYIPDIKAGFIKTMTEKYGETEQKAENEIVAFLKVIEDASNYAFSRNHSTPYSLMGYACGWLRYYYPLEFLTTALNICRGDSEKTAKLIDYSTKLKIHIISPRFGYSTGDYTCNQNAMVRNIYKGISSIKGISDQACERLKLVYKRKYNTMIDFLVDNARWKYLKKNELSILIKIGFFRQYGNVNQLLYLTHLFDKLYGRKNLKKSVAEDMDISRRLAMRHCKKETETQYLNIDPIPIIRALYTYHSVDTSDATCVLAGNQVKYMGYTDVIDPKRDWQIACVTNIDDRYSPVVTLYSLHNGHSTDMKIHKSIPYASEVVHTSWRDTPLKIGDVIYIDICKKEHCRRKGDDGKWHTVSDTEWWIDKYHIIYREEK